jgi:hypothetical protein
MWYQNKNFKKSNHYFFSMQNQIIFLLVLQNTKTALKLFNNNHNYLIFKYLFLF